MARGINDVVVAVVASPQSTVIGGATADGARSGRGVGAARRDGPRGRRRRGIALPAGRPDPRRAVRGAGRAHPDDAGGSLLLRDRCSTRASEPVCDAGYWADNLRHTVRFAAAVQAALEDGYRVFAELSPHPLLTHAVEQTAAQPGHAGGRPGRACGASSSCRTGCAASWRICTARAPRWTSRCSTRAGAWWTRRCRRGPTVPLLLTRDGQDRRARGAHTVAGASAAGRACAAARGAGTPRLAGRRRHRRRTRGWATTRSTTWPRFRAPPTARWRWPRPARSSASSPRSATSASSRCCCSTTRPRSPPSRR